MRDEDDPLADVIPLPVDGDGDGDGGPNIGPPNRLFESDSPALARMLA